MFQRDSEAPPLLLYSFQIAVSAPLELEAEVVIECNISETSSFYWEVGDLDVVLVSW